MVLDSNGGEEKGRKSVKESQLKFLGWRAGNGLG